MILTMALIITFFITALSAAAGYYGNVAGAGLITAFGMYVVYTLGRISGMTEMTEILKEKETDE